VTKSNIVAEFLAGHALFPCRAIVKVLTEIGIIQLGVSLQDMTIGINGNACVTYGSQSVVVLLIIVRSIDGVIRAQW